MTEIRSVVRRSAYLMLGSLDAVLARPPAQLLVLCHHGVDFLPRQSWRFAVEWPEMQRQVDILARRYRFISAAELEAFLAGRTELPGPSVLLTFDDGYRELLALREYMSERGIRPLVFALSEAERVDRETLGTDRELLGHDEIRELSTAGWDIGSHGATHIRLGGISRRRMRLEVAGSKGDLESLLGREVRYFAYPRGQYDQDALEAVRDAGYSLAFTMDDAPLTRGTDPLHIPRVGVDGTHSLAEFKVLGSPSVSGFRGLVKRVASTGIIGEWVS